MRVDSDEAECDDLLRQDVERGPRQEHTIQRAAPHGPQCGGANPHLRLSHRLADRLGLGGHVNHPGPSPLIEM